MNESTSHHGRNPGKASIELLPLHGNDPAYQDDNSSLEEPAMKRMTARLQDLMAEHGTKLLSQVTGIRNGDPESIHDARVATRRIRAILSVLGDEHDQAYAAFHQQLRVLGRALGAARDLDVIADMIEMKGGNRSAGARAVTSFKKTVHQEREEARRRLIKAVEAVPLSALVATEGGRLRRWWATSKDFPAKLRTRMSQQNDVLTESVERASGVYFPNRAHDVRIQSKRMRYLLELATRAGRWKGDHELKVLMGVQRVLGDVHDREVLIQRLADVAADDRDEIDAVSARLRRERDDLFEKYLALRDPLTRATESIRAATQTRSWNWPLVAATVGIPSALVVGMVAADRRRSPRPATYAQPLAGRK